MITSIQLIGLSGSIAMDDADRDDDIDLFIISKKGRMWTARFMCLIIAWILGLRRKRNQKSAPNKVCLNLFFDERELSVPQYKRNEYTAHEVLQMKPLIIKGDIYRRFLQANEWVGDYFPNASFVTHAKAGIYKNRNNLHRFPVKAGNDNDSIFYPIYSLVEILLKILQLYFINLHKSTEIITPTQLWFFPRDFEKKLKSKKLI